MNKVAALSAGERRDLFQETGARRGMSPAIAEKDFWVCWVLKRLFEDPELRGRMVFKGGTTLSKVYGLIDRFSEDIDLVLDWRLLGYGAALDEEPATSTQRDKFNKGMNAKAAAYIGGPLLAPLAATLAGAGVAMDAEDSHTVNIAYPGSISRGVFAAGGTAGDRAFGVVGTVGGEGDSTVCRGFLSGGLRGAGLRGGGD